VSLAAIYKWDHRDMGVLKKGGITSHLIGPGGLQIETHGQQKGSTGIKWASQIKLVQLESSKTKLASIESYWNN